MNHKTVWTLFVAALITAIVAVGFWHHDHEALQATRGQVLTSTLEPLANLLKEDQTLIHELQSDPFTEPSAGILASYLAKIRRDGVPKHADMKQRLDQLAENNTAIVTLIKSYAPQVHTSAFTSEADKFRNYASAWRDRWNSVMELFMAGGNYPASEVPFPKEFWQAVQGEAAASQ
jgi:hypothetical protein